MDVFIFPCCPGVQVLGGEHRGAVAAANGNHDEHIGQGIGGTHCQCSSPQSYPQSWNPATHVKLLEQVAQNHGKCKHQETLPGLPPLSGQPVFQLPNAPQAFSLNVSRLILPSNSSSSLPKMTAPHPQGLVVDISTPQSLNSSMGVMEQPPLKNFL